MDDFVKETAAASHTSARVANLIKLLRYKQWADRLSFDSLAEVPEEEAWKQRRTVFGNMVHTLNHIVVIDDIFRHHMNGTAPSLHQAQHGRYTTDCQGPAGIGRDGPMVARRGAKLV